MTSEIDLLLAELNTEETLLLNDCQSRFETIGRIVTVEGFCLELVIRISDQITREHERILDNIDCIEQIKKERAAANTTKNAMIRMGNKNVRS
jgi:hypothetical protein